MFAQSFGGRVSSEGTPVVGATVMIKSLSRGTATDTDGKYSLSVDPGTYVVTFSSIGYATKVVSISVEGTAEKILNVEMQAEAKQLGDIVIVGTRASGRTVTDSPLPIDILSTQTLSNTGQVSFDKILQVRVPSFNVSQTPVNDATAILDPWEIRNMGVSRTLILINGKRKNLSALVYTQTSPSRGETGVDISAIPMDAIKRVEVLRDGASAQYGSDAVAGVINIVLKDNTEGGYVTMNSGVTGAGDGARFGVSLNNGSSVLGDKGFVNYTVDLSRVDEARRSGVVNADGEIADFGATATEVNNFLAYDKYAGNRNSSPATSAAKFALNAGMSISDNTELYGNVAYVYKKVNSYANYRTPYWRTLSSFPYLKDFFGNGTAASYKGYVPTFDGDLIDYNGTIGFRTKKNQWNYDASFTFGFNSQDYTVFNSHNRSADTTANGAHVYQENSPINFKPGGTTFSHQVWNLDISRAVTDKLNVAVGSEFRSETFAIIEGDKASWDGVGADSFAGNRPENSGTFNRFNFGGYVDVGYDISKAFLVSGTIRTEYFSDFGNDFVYKFSSRYKLMNDKVTVRGSYSTGFKAPTLHQIYTQRVQYSFVPGQGIQAIGLINNVSPQARVLGVKPLKPEESTNITFGAGANLIDNLSLTVDWYKIDIDNRIVISNEANYGGGGSVNFFTNSISTTTSGIDFVADYKDFVMASGTLDLSLAANINLSNERVGSVPTVKGLPVIDYTQEALFFTSRPSQKLVLGASYDRDRLNVTLNNTYFGPTEFHQNGIDPNLKTVFKPKLVTDVGVTYQLYSNLSVSANINNVLDVTPQWDFEALNSTGTALLNNAAQKRNQFNLLTFNGRYSMMTYDGFHFSQLGRMFNLTVNYGL
jgi:iron complex outermembrane receptor protein